MQSRHSTEGRTVIVANVRSQLTREDVALALALVAQHGTEARDQSETALREQGLDALLDDPHLLAGLLETPRGAHASLPLFAYVLVRQALVQDGDPVVEPETRTETVQSSTRVREDQGLLALPAPDDRLCR